MKRLGSKGLTLLELTVTAAMAAIMVAAVVVLVGRGLTAWTRADARLQQLFQMQKALAQVEQDLRQSVALAEPLFVGESSRLVFFRSEGPTQLVQLEYRLEEESAGKTLLRERREFPLSEEEEPESRRSLERVRAFSLEYAALQESGGEPELDWLPAWSVSEQSSAVPELVRITVECDDPKGGRLSLNREVWVPHGTLAVPTGE